MESQVAPPMSLPSHSSPRSIEPSPQVVGGVVSPEPVDDVCPPLPVVAPSLVDPPDPTPVDVPPSSLSFGS